MVQADGRLVEDVQEVFEATAEHDREPGALRLTARQRRHRPVEREVTQTQGVQGPQSPQQFVLQASGPPADRELLDEPEDLGHRAGQQLVESDAGDAMRRRVGAVVKRRRLEGSDPGAAAGADRCAQHGRTTKKDLGPAQGVGPLQRGTDLGRCHAGAKGGHPDNDLMPRRWVEARNRSRLGPRPRPSIDRDLGELPAQAREQPRVTAGQPAHHRNVDVEAVPGREQVQRDREALLAGCRPHLHAAARAADLGEARVQDPQEWMHPDRRRHRRGGVAVEHVLSDRYGRT